MSGTWGDRIRERKRHYFVGRGKEMEAFEALLLDPARTERALHLYGPGGIGKSTLLDHFSYRAEECGVPFYSIDSRDFSHTPEGFCGKLHDVLAGKPDASGNGTESPREALRLCLSRLSALTKEKQRLVLALDTYEEMGDLDDWLRDTFLPELPDAVLVVLAGRHLLSAEWRTPIWRPFLLEVPLSFFDRTACQAFADRFAGLPVSRVDRLFSLTKGHPLALSLLLSLSVEDSISLGAATEGSRDDGDGLSGVLRQAAESWLREIRDPELQELVEAASLVRVFNLELLEHMRKKPISLTEFDRLTGLSFVRKSKRGWFVHDLLRGPLSQEAARRQPQVHEAMRRRCLEQLSRQLTRGSSEAEASLAALDLIYVWGNTTIRSIFMDESGESPHSVKPLRADQLEEARGYMQRILSEGRDVVQQFFDPHTHEHYENVMPHAFIRSAYSVLDLDRWAAFGDSVVHVVRNERQEAGCLIVLVPLHRETLPLLEENPVSRSYFATLSPAEKKSLAAPPHAPAGRFIYHLDQWGDHSAQARSTFFQFLMRQLMGGGLFIHSSPLKLHQDVMISLGFQEVPEAAHTDFGGQLLSRTFHLDLRGECRTAYLKTLIGGPEGPPHEEEPVDATDAPVARAVPSMDSLTPREREIARWAIEGLTSAEIAKRLYVTEITVKKHLGSIYRKLQVSGRVPLTQLLTAESARTASTPPTGD